MRLALRFSLDKTHARMYNYTITAKELMMKDKILTAVFGIAVALFILSVSIGLPIYVRPFYYLQVDALNIELYSGFDRETIIEAYDEMITYCTVPWAEFSTGDLKFSEEGASHFADCKGLFLLDGAVILISTVLVVALFILSKRGVFKMARPFGYHVTFVSAIALLGTFVLVGGLAATNFQLAFTIFHKLMFPGKDNWLFDPRTDEIILILPIDFFMNCAILIVASIILMSASLIIHGALTRDRK